MSCCHVVTVHSPMPWEWCDIVCDRPLYPHSVCVQWGSLLRALYPHSPMQTPSCLTYSMYDVEPIELQGPECPVIPPINCRSFWGENPWAKIQSDKPMLPFKSVKSPLVTSKTCSQAPSWMYSIEVQGPECPGIPPIF